MYWQWELNYIYLKEDTKKRKYFINISLVIFFFDDYIFSIIFSIRNMQVTLQNDEKKICCWWFDIFWLWRKKRKLAFWPWVRLPSLSLLLASQTCPTYESCKDNILQFLKWLNLSPFFKFSHCAWIFLSLSLSLSLSLLLSLTLSKKLWMLSLRQNI